MKKKDGRDGRIRSQNVTKKNSWKLNRRHLRQKLQNLIWQMYLIF